MSSTGSFLYYSRFMKTCIRLFVFLLLVFTSLTCVAEDVVSRLIAQADEKKLAASPYWHKLLHYQKTNGGELVSEITSPHFFLSAQGAHDPNAELAATLRAFFVPMTDDPNNHAQCRFVARYRWLQQSLDLKGTSPIAVPCTQFEKWSRQGQYNSVSLIFASGYFSNPASFYGHLLMKFNLPEGASMAGLLDESLNFGAIVPENEMMLLYVGKGMFGGYDGAFSGTQFYRQNHTYAEDELRDLWEYELSLSKEDVDRLTAHAWELLQGRFDYYFLKQNCAFRMSELLELVVDQPLLPASLPWSMPSTVFERINRVEYHGQPLVRSIKLIPSRLSSFHTRYQKLNKAQSKFALDWTKGEATFTSDAYATLDEAGKANLVDALLDYVEFRHVDSHDDREYKRSRQELLVERLLLPPRLAVNHNEVRADTQKYAPHEGALPGMLRIGVVHNSERGGGMVLRLRPVYFDRLSLEKSRVPYSTLTMMEVELLQRAGRLSMKRWDMVNIEHLNVARTPLPGDGGWAWRIRFGLDSHELACDSCLVGHVSGGLGKSLAFSTHSVSYVMADSFVQTQYRSSGNIGGGVSAGWVETLGNGWKSSIEVGRKTYWNGSHSDRELVKWENRLGMSRDWDVRFGFEKLDANQWSMAVSGYW